MNVAQILAVVFLGIAAVVGAVALRFYRARRAFVAASVVTEGVIVGRREDPAPSDGTPAVFPSVRFPTADGREVTFESSAGGAADAFPIGGKVAVRYPADRPGSAELAALGSLWGPAIVLAALAVVFLAVAVGLWSGAIPL